MRPGPCGPQLGAVSAVSWTTGAACMAKLAPRTSTRAFQEAARCLGRTLRALRAERGWTQRLAADRCGIGVAVLRRLEQGRGNPSLALLHSLAREYDVELILLLGSLKI